MCWDLSELPAATSAPTAQVAQGNLPKPNIPTLAHRWQEKMEDLGSTLPRGYQGRLDTVYSMLLSTPSGTSAENRGWDSVIPCWAQVQIPPPMPSSSFTSRGALVCRGCSGQALGPGSQHSVLQMSSP